MGSPLKPLKMPPHRHSVPGVDRGNMDFQILCTLISRIFNPHTKPFTHGFSCVLFNRDILYVQDGFIEVVSLFSVCTMLSCI